MPRDDHDDRDDLNDSGEQTAMPAAFAEPDEKTFWTTYSPRFEMPISYTGSALAIASCVGLLALLMTLSIRGDKDKPGATIGMVDGQDETGLGMQGDGGKPDPLTIGFNTPTPEDIKNILPDPNITLPDVTANIQKDIQLDDPNARVPIADQNKAAFAAMDKELRDKTLGLQKGSGGPNAKGDNGTGMGDGGVGADSTRARSLRWVMRFKTSGGRDYLSQLSAFGAEVIVPLAGNAKAASYIFRDLANPKPGTMTTDADWSRLSGKMQFVDYTRDSLKQIREGLGLDFTPKMFIAYFPKEIEERMQKMEKGYQNRRSEDIDETIFEVVLRNGKYEIFVAGQKLKR